jgi:hypothetical protein
MRWRNACRYSRGAPMLRSKHLGFAALLLAALVCVMGVAGRDGSTGQASPEPALGTGGSSPTAGAEPSASRRGAGTAAPLGGLFLPSGQVPEATLHRLTQSELTHSLQDLLGADVPVGEVEPDALVAGFSSIGASSIVVSPAGVALHERQVLAATGHVLSSRARVRATLPCVPASTADRACLVRIISRFGRRAFRRPLRDDEIRSYTGLATAVGTRARSDVLTGVRYALAAILESASFLYRVELGAPSEADGGRLKYTGYEMASRLAALFWDSVPDDPLLDAAEAGLLATAEGVRAAAQRLMADPKARRSVQAFTRELFDTSALMEARKDDKLFPGWHDSLKEAMREELERRVLDMVFVRQGDFLSLYDDRKTFVNDELAAFYRLPVRGQSGFYPAEFPPSSKRAGLLGAGAILAGHALPHRTSPTERGKFVSEMLLCRSVLPPPDDVPPLAPPAGPEMTLRQRLELHRKAPSCASCHAKMDPIGFGMEDFDGVGRYRTMDGTSPLDASGVLDGRGLDGSSFTGLAELGAALRRQPVLAPCLVSKVYARALGRSALSVDGAALEELMDSFTEHQHRFDQLLISLALSDSFRFVEPKG